MDIILRDCARVRTVLDETEQGRFSCNHQPGRTHAYLNVMYRDELAICRVLQANAAGFMREKEWASAYPSVLRRELIRYFSV